MKKTILFFALMFSALGVFAQVEPPTDIFDAIGSFETYMATLGGVAVLSVFMTGFINGLFKVTSSTIRLVVSWVVPVVLTALAGLILNIGFLADVQWWLVLLYGFGAGLVANRGYDLNTIKQIILFIETLFGNKKEEEV